MPLPLILGAAAGIGGAIGNIFSAGAANKRLDSLYKQDPTYSANPLAGQRLALAQTMLNARAPGATIRDEQLQASGANAFDRVQRGATDSSQLLSLGAGLQGQQDQSVVQSGVLDAEDQQRRYQNLSGATEGAIGEGDKVYGDQVRRFGDLSQIRGQQQKNRTNAWQSLSNLGFAGLNLGIAAGKTTTTTPTPATAGAGLGYNTI